MPDGNDVTAEDKAWGFTRCVHRDATHEVWHASPRAGGFSSRHYHRKTPNKFYAVAGTLLVETFRGGAGGPEASPLEVFHLTAGQELTVEEGVWHRFRALTDCELIEIYWAFLRPGGDIVRADVGGREATQ